MGKVGLPLSLWLLATLMALQTNVDALASLDISKQKNSADHMLDVADEMVVAHNELTNLTGIIERAMSGLKLGSSGLSNGICNFLGFCRTNPAYTCQEIADQPGVEELPDGKYWLVVNPIHLGSDAPIPPTQIHCHFGENGKAWALFFDDTFAGEIIQQPSHPLLNYFHFREVLVQTPEMIEKGKPPVSQIVYFVDQLILEKTKGKTISELYAKDWKGQDGWGRNNSAGAFPQEKVHNRWKYFGKLQAENYYLKTLFILDDGNIEDETCKLALDLGKCGQDFFCQEMEGKQSAGRIAQTNLPKTPNGIISFGCTDDEFDFTMCGSCTYEGLSGTERSKKLRSSVVQRMFVR